MVDGIAFPQDRNKADLFLYRLTLCMCLFNLKYQSPCYHKFDSLSEEEGTHPPTPPSYLLRVKKQGHWAHSEGQGHSTTPYTIPLAVENGSEAAILFLLWIEHKRLATRDF